MANWSVSVLVPTYNHEQWILTALESIVTQDIFEQVKVLVADDCSLDSTIELIDKFAERYSNIFVYRNERNLGVLPNYASLAQRCDTEFVAILEGDDYWIKPDKLSKQLEFLQAADGMDGCFSEFYVVDEIKGIKLRRPTWADGRYKVLSLIDILYENSSASFSTCCYRTKAFHSSYRKI